ncbi:MAG: tRNA (N(6)-L-threonylcarbamoyladenosine(37)-C(2))-methylthiotransferase MtaB [Clostridia bacterium]|nr:tRNA (N(6)-L-threonylcarbamoyladenosine(37)-C(2))-methylthiotransferase MtaB [Clostridia bacterium]
MKAVVFTLGCKVNECESNSIMNSLSSIGYEVSDKLEYADLYVVNTCAVTQEAQKKSRQTASRILKLNPNAKIIFTGCATQHAPQEFVNKTPNCLVTGTFNKGLIPQLIEKSGVIIANQSDCYENLEYAKSLGTRTFIKVQDGCNNFCSYCIIPYLRGRTRSREPQSIVQEINSLSVSEAVITGINLSSYNYQGCDLTGLMQALKEVNARIRLGSLEVRVITDQFLQALSNLKNFARHFHLSLQSGSDNVLKSMNRKYSASEFIEKSNLIRKYFPDAGITTDIIVGFPTESEKDFLDTINLVKTVDFSDIHPFIFSPREGTVAFKMKDLDYNVKKDRLDRLVKIKQEQKNAFTKKMIGKTLEIIAEEKVGEYVVGYTDNYLRTYIKGDIKYGEIYKVKIQKEYKDGAIATLI